MPGFRRPADGAGRGRAVTLAFRHGRPSELAQAPRARPVRSGRSPADGQPTDHKRAGHVGAGASANRVARGRQPDVLAGRVDVSRDRSRVGRVRASGTCVGRSDGHGPGAENDRGPGRFQAWVGCVGWSSQSWPGLVRWLVGLVSAGDSDVLIGRAGFGRGWVLADRAGLKLGLGVKTGQADLDTSWGESLMRCGDGSWVGQEEGDGGVHRPSGGGGEQEHPDADRHRYDGRQHTEDPRRRGPAVIGREPGCHGGSRWTEGHADGTTWFGSAEERAAQYLNEKQRRGRLPTHEDSESGNRSTHRRHLSLGHRPRPHPDGASHGSKPDLHPGSCLERRLGGLAGQAGESRELGVSAGRMDRGRGRERPSAGRFRPGRRAGRV